VNGTFHWDCHGPGTPVLEPPITTWNEPSDERLTGPPFGTPLADDETIAIFAGFPTNLTATPWNPDGLPINTWPPVQLQL